MLVNNIGYGGGSRTGGPPERPHKSNNPHVRIGEMNV
jgi:hypothetical protein